MFSRLYLLATRVRAQQNFPGLAAARPMDIVTASITTTAPLKAAGKTSSGVEMIDIDSDAMMNEDYEPMDSPESSSPSNGLTYTTLSGVSLAPIDVDPWEEEEEVKQGTVEFEQIEKKPIEYPPIPPANLRSGVYEFKGIKVKLPKKLLKPETYRWRLDPEDEKTVPDDLRVCMYENKDV